MITFTEGKALGHQVLATSVHFSQNKEFSGIDWLFSTAPGKAEEENDELRASNSHLELHIMT